MVDFLVNVKPKQVKSTISIPQYDGYTLLMFTTPQLFIILPFAANMKIKMENKTTTTAKCETVFRLNYIPYFDRYD